MAEILHCTVEGRKKGGRRRGRMKRGENGELRKGRMEKGEKGER